MERTRTVQQRTLVSYFLDLELFSFQIYSLIRLVGSLVGCAFGLSNE